MKSSPALLSTLRSAVASTPAAYLFVLGVWLIALGAATHCARALAREPSAGLSATPACTPTTRLAAPEAWTEAARRPGSRGDPLERSNLLGLEAVAAH